MHNVYNVYELRMVNGGGHSSDWSSSAEMKVSARNMNARAHLVGH